MKTFFVSLVVFLVTLAFVMPLVADEADANSPQTEVEAVEQGDSYVESIDPNSTSHGLGKYRSQLQQFNRAVMQEARELTQEDGSKEELIKAMREQLIAELELIKAVALDENAKKTVAAIDHIMAQRLQRFDKINERLERDKSRLDEQRDPNTVDANDQPRRPRTRERVNPRERTAQRERNRPRESRQRTRIPRSSRTREPRESRNRE